MFRCEEHSDCIKKIKIMVMQLILKKGDIQQSQHNPLTHWVGLVLAYKYFSVFDSDRIVYSVDLLNWNFI